MVICGIVGIQHYLNFECVNSKDATMEKDTRSGDVYLAVVDGLLRWVCDKKSPELDVIVELLNNRSKRENLHQKPYQCVIVK